MLPLSNLKAPLQKLDNFQYYDVVTLGIKYSPLLGICSVVSIDIGYLFNELYIIFVKSVFLSQFCGFRENGGKLH